MAVNVSTVLGRQRAAARPNSLEKNAKTLKVSVLYTLVLHPSYQN